MRKCSWAVVVMAALVVAGSLTYAAVPQLINYQGVLRDSSGPVTGTRSMLVSLYTTSSGGSAVWSETQDVTVTNGAFSIVLGSIIPVAASVFDNAEVWLAVTIETDEMSPRQRVTSVGYAMRAVTADNVITFPTITATNQIISSVQTGTAPLQVSSTTMVANLNAEMVGGKRAADLWQTGGNAGTTAGTNFIGTTDNQALEIKVNGIRAYRIEPNGTSPNIIGGYNGNSLTTNVYGAIISGGGDLNHPNRVTDAYGFVGGGYGNTAGDSNATIGDIYAPTVGGGSYNTASGNDATVSGGSSNTASGIYAAVEGGTSNTASGAYAAVAGGMNNNASGQRAAIGGGAFNVVAGTDATVAGGNANTASSSYATVGGGGGNAASGGEATVSGGFINTASGFAATVGGGDTNTASGMAATVAGGYGNLAGGDTSFAAGNRARVRDTAAAGNSTGDQGTFVWADSQNADFTSNGQNQFLVRASGGVGINTNAPLAGMSLDVSGNTRIGGNLLANAVGLGTSSPNRPVHIRHTGAAEMNLEISDAQSGWRVWNLIAGGSPAGQQQNFTFRILSDDANSVTKDVFVLGYTGNATLAGTLTQNSDLRLKTDIQPLEGPLGKVLRLRGVSYRMKDDETNARRIGVIAQEIEQEYPELVLTDDKGIKSVAYANLTPVLIEAIKEQENVIERQEAKIAEQKAELDALRAEVAAIKAMLGK